MFFSKAGEYTSCGIYNVKHLLISAVTLIGIIIAIKITKIKKQDDVKKIIKITTIILWCLEILKISYLFITGQAKVNGIVPLYYCSLLLYSGLMSAYGRGIIKKMGDTFLATGGIVGGMFYLMFPTTSLPAYPLFHFISFHSFIYHGIMIYLCIIVNKTKYVELKISDFKYYSGLVFITCMLAYIVNEICESNLMFISRDFPGSPLSFFYNNMGIFYGPTAIFVLMTLPFFIADGIIQGLNKFQKSKLD